MFLFAEQKICISYVHFFSLYPQMMWALEYDPDLFSIYEEPELNGDKGEGSKGRAKSIRHYGKFERENMKNGAANSEGPLPMSVFLVASVLKDKSSKLLHEARGLDDVVKGMPGDLLQLGHPPLCVYVSQERFKLKFQAGPISISSCHNCALLVEEQSQTPPMTLLFGV
ncbi:hypothetical protein OIU78_025251 [Salix suchowensis]|nr:hypothetical protein OIU78_025251 [Salix suchowensis]